jgi:multidrug efflux pump subunit AcrA (membrane-fusion protein)
MNRRVLILLLIVIAGISSFVYFQRANAQPATQFQTARIERGSLKTTIGATGTVRAKQTAILIWQAAGTVDTVNVKVGDNIPQGFVMAYLAKTSLPQSVICSTPIRRARRRQSPCATRKGRSIARTITANRWTA